MPSCLPDLFLGSKYVDARHHNSFNSVPTCSCYEEIMHRNRPCSLSRSFPYFAAVRSPLELRAVCRQRCHLDCTKPACC